ncbi:HDIG domain-containing metalloprotein [Maridesulfovibrio hydrothermalis]|uniref:Metal dependent phosphohydrolase n=1 Tax=Maridesulfovibrio hydrothermalis AM13 = DSM 14728 TaxID=1121451 RepID=L0RDG3_9BACT|nr:HDIG domain-containing metalloprotein [Maridesulfovibrio hydrothermalis]CCO24262.1 Metal dependent phosphohydrolase [Maridesulfovibrio hydrothermalis AM13 = DSM 14728]
MISRKEAFKLLQDNTPEEKLIQHALESEAVLGALAEKLGKDIELWSITGLLHDLDYSTTSKTPEQHGLVSAEMLNGKLPDSAIQAIKAHNEMTGVQAKTEFDYALRCGETITGLIHANALIRPEKIKGMKAKSLKKKMKAKAFAASVNRDIIKECEKIGLDINEFFTLSIKAIEEVAPEVGLT